MSNSLLSGKLVPLVVKSSHGQSKVSSSFSISLLAHILIQPGLELICQPRIINKLLAIWFSPEPVTVYQSCPDQPVRLLVRLVDKMLSNMSFMGVIFQSYDKRHIF